MMSSWDVSYVFDEDLNETYVSESVFRPNDERGEEEVVSMLRCDDGRMQPVLPDLI
ncbi:hypothetical protein Hanom_Chr06g00512421 [Helianthus anomalus]